MLEASECCICLNSIEHPNDIWVNTCLPCECSASYHITCVEEWFRKSRKQTCPICHSISENTDTSGLTGQGIADTHQTITYLECSCGTCCITVMCLITIPVIINQLHVLQWI